MSEPARFITTLKSEDVPGGGRWRLLTPLVYYSALLARHIVVQRGTEADSYSVPAAFAWLVHKLDRRPAFIHDELYSGRIAGVTREQADAVILEACEAVGISWWRRRLIFRGTRIGGWAFFKGPKTPPIDPEQPLDHSPGA
jgi:hypothetical protein